MSRPSNDKLRDMLSQCAHDFQTLANDEEWSGQVPVVIRRAVPILIKRVAESARYVVVIAFNADSIRYPKEVRRVLGTRSPNVLLCSRWNPTEALLVLADEPMKYSQTLAPIVANAGLQASFYLTPYSGNLQMDYERAIHSYPAHYAGEHYVRKGVCNET